MGGILNHRTQGASRTSYRGSSPWTEVRVGRQRGDAAVLDRPSDGKMIKALKCRALKAEERVERVVEIAPDPGRSDGRIACGRGFGLEIERLSKDAGLPE